MASPFHPVGVDTDCRVEQTSSPQRSTEISSLLSAVNKSLDILYDLICKHQDAIDPVLDQSDRVNKGSDSPSPPPPSSMVGGELNGINLKIETLSEKVAVLTARVLL